MEKQVSESKIIIAVGCGGVGKTTISAALALKAAMAGKRAIVCTIDPAKRLADVLSISMQPGEIVEVSVDGNLSFDALMLDNKKTFDQLINRLTHSEKRRQKMVNNRIYQAVSTTFARISEYMAMEKLYELYEEEDYDLIILDTPPSKHTIEFLVRPNIIINFVDQNVIGWVIKPYIWATKMGMGFFLNKAGKVFKTFSDFLGAAFMLELAELLVLFEELIVKFRVRAKKIEDLLRDPTSGFVVVASPAPFLMKEALFLVQNLNHHQLRLKGCIINKTLPEHALAYGPHKFCNLSPLPKAVLVQYRSSLRKFIANYHQMKKRYQEEQKLIKNVQAALTSDVKLTQVHQFAQGVNSMEMLKELAAIL